MNPAIRLQSIEPRQLQLGVLGAIVLLAGAFIAYLLLPQWREYQALTHSLQILEAAVDDGTSLDMQLNALQAEVDRLERTLSGDASNLPARQMEAFVIGRLQTISWRNGMDLVGVQPRQGAPLRQFNELVFDVELQGGYFEFFRWLHQIGEELGFVVVKRFEIDALNNRTSDVPRLRVKLTLAAYRNSQS